MLCFILLKTALYFITFVCYLANPVPEIFAALTALFALAVDVSFLLLRQYYMKQQESPEQ